MAEYADARISFCWPAWLSGNHVLSIDIHVLDHTWATIASSAPSPQKWKPASSRSRSGSKSTGANSPAAPASELLAAGMPPPETRQQGPTREEENWMQRPPR
jgi:hypothetical protein